jgi:hypothetical protein
MNTASIPVWMLATCMANAVREIILEQFALLHPFPEVRMYDTVIPRAILVSTEGGFSETKIGYSQTWYILTHDNLYVCPDIQHGPNDFRPDWSRREPADSRKWVELTSKIYELLIDQIGRT